MRPPPSQGLPGPREGAPVHAQRLPREVRIGVDGPWLLVSREGIRRRRVATCCVAGRGTSDSEDALPRAQRNRADRTAMVQFYDMWPGPTRDYVSPIKMGSVVINRLCGVWPTWGLYVRGHEKVMTLLSHYMREPAMVKPAPATASGTWYGPET